MGLDIYVGPLLRYYTGEWETVVQKYGRQSGYTVQVLRANMSEEQKPASIAGTLELITTWRARLNEGLADYVKNPLSWKEHIEEQYFSDKPTWDCYASLLLRAAYSEHPELECPVNYVEEWKSDPAYEASAADGFRTAFPQLLQDVEFWLPSDFNFTFRTEDLTGRQIGFGSSHALVRELEELNRRTWLAGDDELALWRRKGAAYQSPLDTGAKFAFAIMLNLAKLSVEHMLPMKLDY